jgi:hypothetical protein
MKRARDGHGNHKDPAQDQKNDPTPAPNPNGRDKGDDNKDLLAEMDPSQLAMMTRSERKRHREKKRRSDVNRGFEDLLGLLVEVDAGVRIEVEEERLRRAQARGEAVHPAAGQGGPSSPSSPSLLLAEENLLSRVDLIDRATNVLRRIHRENEQRKVLIDQLIFQQRLRVNPSSSSASTAAASSASMASRALNPLPSVLVESPSQDLVCSLFVNCIALLHHHHHHLFLLLLLLFYSRSGLLTHRSFSYLVLFFPA